MRLIQHAWTEMFGNTHVLHTLNEQNLIPEWRPEGYVIRRQVYDQLPASWYIYRISEGGLFMIGDEADLAEAQKRLLQHCP